jgi:S-formylglutathione hydrolase FrmB
VKQISFLVILLLFISGTEVYAKWFQQRTIFSQALQQEKIYYVGLPTGYDESDTITKYPVILFLHGASVNATDMVNTIEPFLDNVFTRLFFSKLFKVIFIIPDGSCAPYKGSFYTNSALYGNYEDYITNDVIKEIGKEYHTYNQREKWSIMGHSMGGYGAMKIAMKFPEKFIGVSSLSGPLNITELDELIPDILAEHGSAEPYQYTYSGNITKLVYSMAGAFSPNPGADPPIFFPLDSTGSTIPAVLETWESYNPINQIRMWHGDPAMAIHMYCGEKDEFKLAKPNQMFSDTLTKYNLPHTYYQDPSGDHINSLVTSFPQGINFLYHVMDTAQIRISTKNSEQKAVNQLSIYPNPAGKQIYLSGDTDDIIKTTIYNLTGQQVAVFSELKYDRFIDIQHLQKGMYVISVVFSNGNTYSQRMNKL